MTEPSAPLSSSSDADLSEMLSCHICFEGYSRERLPKLLRCGHSFCLFCLQEMERRSSTIKCPRCQQVAKEKVAALSTNFQLLDVVDELSRAKTAKQSLLISAKCYECGESLQALRACTTCSTIQAGVCVKLKNFSQSLRTICAECATDKHTQHEISKYDSLEEAMRGESRKRLALVCEERTILAVTVREAIHRACESLNQTAEKEYPIETFDETIHEPALAFSQTALEFQAIETAASQHLITLKEKADRFMKTVADLATKAENPEIPEVQTPNEPRVNRQPRPQPTREEDKCVIS